MAQGSDRTVHGYNDSGDEIVRYDRAGKWYLEVPGGKRVGLSLAEAATLAVEGRAIFNLPGGGAFDSRVRKITAEITA